MTTKQKKDVDVNGSKSELMVIGTGLGRTGTRSLWAALKKLGFNECHHFREIGKDKGSGKIWNKLILSKIENPEKLVKTSCNEWELIFTQKYKSGVDEPISLFYKELMEYYPKSKFILTIRDNSDKWYKSYKTLFQVVLAIDKLWFIRLFSSEFVYNQAVALNIMKLKFGDDYQYKLLNDAEFCKKIYEKWNENVIKYIPKNRLLVFNVKQGWEPLCNFLEIKNIPNEPFPHLNETGDIKKFKIVANVMRNVVNYGLVVAAAVVCYRLYNVYK